MLCSKDVTVVFQRCGSCVLTMEEEQRVSGDPYLCLQLDLIEWRLQGIRGSFIMSVIWGPGGEGGWHNQGKGSIIK